MEHATKKQSGKLTIHDKDVVDHVILESQKAKSEFELQKSKQPTKLSDSVISSLPKTPSTLSVTKLPLNKSANVQNWLDKKTIKELQERTDQETLSAKKLYSSLLETEQTFVKKLDDLLTHKELVDLRRKELLYLKWSEQVFEPIRKKIVEAVDGSDWLHLDRRKREMHRQFLEHVNRRGYVFLEDDDREQYYGQALNDHRPAPIKITTEVLKDPLLTLSRKRAEEERTIIQCSTGYKYSDKDVETVKLPPLPLIPLGRHGVDSRKWLQMPLANIESESRMRSRESNAGSVEGIECWESTQSPSLTSVHGPKQDLTQSLLSRSSRFPGGEHFWRSHHLVNRRLRSRKPHSLTPRNLLTKSLTQTRSQRTWQG